MEALVKTRELVKSYGMGEGIVYALNGVDFEMQAGELVAITGTSGSGKSTLLHMIGGMDSPSSGTVVFQETDISQFTAKQKAEYRCKKVGFVFQNFKLIEELNVRENIIMPVLIAGRKVDEAYYNQLVEMLGLSERQSHLPSELSGGQKQRTAIARALINQPELLLADEPTGNLDHTTSEEIMQIFLKLHEQGKTILVVTHDWEIAGRCQRQVEMWDGKCVRDEVSLAHEKTMCK